MEAQALAIPSSYPDKFTVMVDRMRVLHLPNWDDVVAVSDGIHALCDEAVGRGYKVCCETKPQDDNNYYHFWKLSPDNASNERPQAPLHPYR